MCAVGSVRFRTEAGGKSECSALLNEYIEARRNDDKKQEIGPEMAAVEN